MSPAKTCYLIDGSSFIYRAYHAIRSLTNSQGMSTNAVFGFTRMLMKLIEERQPDFAAVCFDAKGPTFRHEIFPQYKAHRPPMPEDLVAQIPYIHEVVSGLGIKLEIEVGFEADDLIGTLAEQAQQMGFEVVIVTGDKDFLQLISPQVSLWDPMKEKATDLAAFKEAYHLEPAQMIDVMGLSGDASDGVPGVPGIGPKTALGLIHAHGSLESVYDRIESNKKPKQRQKLLENRAQAELSKALVTICKTAPVTFKPAAWRLDPPDQQALLAIFKKLEFRQLVKQFQTQTAPAETHYELIFSEEQLQALVAVLAKAPILAVDTETTSVDPNHAKLVGISVSTEPHHGAYIPVGHAINPLDLVSEAPVQIALEKALALLKPVLENPAVPKVGQNIKYDWIMFKRYGINLQGVVFDTMLASYLINPSQRSHSLDQIAQTYLDHQTITYAEVAGKGKKALRFDQVAIEKAVDYACEDADVTLRAYHELVPRLKELALEPLFETVEMPLVAILLEMEMAGIQVDCEHLRRLSKTFAVSLAAIESEIYDLAGEHFNVRSSQQLGKILFETLGLPVQKKTTKKTAYSTDVEVLTTLAEQHPLPGAVLKYRGLSKLKSTYVDALLDMVDSESGRIHTSYNQTVTVTGRLSSSDPNLQNIPIRTEEGRQIREAFVAPAGCRLMAADYSQIELRVLAHYAQDPLLTQAFLEGQDIHARTAAEVFMAEPGAVSPELRRQAKAINFGIIYGMSPYGLSKALGISHKMAKTYIDSYFARLPGVKAFIDQTIKTVRQQKYTTTLLGRRRNLPEIDNPNPNIRRAAERTAINTPIQGTAADLIKIAMINVQQAIRKARLSSRMLLSVHDELVFEVPEAEIETMQTMVRKEMGSVWELRVPLEVTLEVGQNWAEAH